MPVDNYVNNENWPATWSLCRLQGQILNADGTPAKGSIWLKPVPTAVYTDSHIILPRSIEVELDGDGSFDQYVPATDDPDINPTDWNYRVTERASNGRTYYINAPGGTTLNLADAAPVPSSPGDAVTVGPAGPLVISEDANNAAQIGTDGFLWVPAASVVGAQHSDLDGLADDDHTQYLNNTRGDVRYYTKAQSDAALEAHRADTTNVHGITNTANIVLTNDARLTDSRNPLTHAGSHEQGGVDQLELNASQVGEGTFLPARLGTETPTGGKYLRGDATWQTGFMVRAVAPTQPSTTGWNSSDFWYDTSTE